MPAKVLFYTATNCLKIRSITITNSHDTSTAIATIDCITTTLTLGDQVEVDMGYTDNHQVIFRGYVKQIDHRAPENVYTITCSDVMTRAMDFFIASSNPLEPLSFGNITAEELIRQLMQKAGLDNFSCPVPSQFTFGVEQKFEVNLVAVFEYCRAIADNLTWALWADENEIIHFENRKPYVMTEASTLHQPGYSDDPAPTFTVDDVLSLDMGITTSEKNLRNRIVVYGEGDIRAEAKKTVSALPAGFYKTSVLGAQGLIDTSNTAQKIADYNLELFCRYTEECRVTLVGQPSLRCRTVVGSNAATLGITGTWYVAACEHAISSGGYITGLGLRRMPKAT
jgi:hypothetical protein